jgi:hypothetical protein
MSLDIQIVSDLHLEFWGNKTKFNFVKPTAPILALLGDTCCMGSDDDFEIFKRFIQEVLPSYEHIVIITGNHEYYYNPTTKAPATKEHTMEAIDKKLKKYCKDTSPKLHFLHNSKLNISVGKKKATIIGSTLWSHIPEEHQDRIQKNMSDYQYIYVQDPKNKRVRNITAKEISELYNKNAKYIKKQLAKAKKEKTKAILFVHHRPYIDSTYNVNGFDPAYHSDLNSSITSPLVFVGFGHTHVNTDITMNGVRVYSNPKGYPNQKVKYDKEAKITIK